MDPEHPALAATVPMIAALARRVDRVAVLADGAAPGVLPPNCRVRTFGAGSRTVRGLRFAAALAAELRTARREPMAVLAHMCPIYAVLAAPMARPLKVPVLLWFTHWRTSTLLREAERLSTAVLSVDRRSFPLPSAKLVVTGHAIDLDEFACADPRAGDGVFRALSLGRTSPAKGYETLLAAARRALDVGLPLRVSIHGPSLTREEQEHRRLLERRIEELNLGTEVELGPPVSRAQVSKLLGGCDVLVNAMRAGAPDKVVYEACASCVRPLASNPVFDGLLPQTLRFEEGNSADLALRLLELSRQDPDERTALGRTLRERIEREHSVGRWAEAVLAAAELT